METIDATINLNSPMFPCFRKAVLSIAVFWEAALLEAGLLGGCTFARQHFWEAVLLGPMGVQIWLK